MSMVQTVLGRIPAESLGHTQCHEHIWLKMGASFNVSPALLMDDYARSLAELKSYKASGGGAIVDAQPGFFGREPNVLARLSHDSGVKIIGVTGFHRLEFLDEGSPVADMSADALAERFCAEVTRGMFTSDNQPTGIRASIIKAAYVAGGFAHTVYARLISGVCSAARETRAPVMIHTEPNADVLELMRYFIDNGVPAERLLVCHLDRTRHELEYHKRLAGMGVTLCYDSIHRLKQVSEDREIALIRGMCEAGYGDRLVLSLDTTNERLRAYGAHDMGLDYILAHYIPTLKTAGVSDADIRRMTHENAARLLAINE